MQYRIKEQGEEATVIFEGDITFTENRMFQYLLKDLTELGLSRCILDLGRVDLIDSAGLGMLLIAREQADKSGYDLAVTGANGHVEKMLKLTKLNELLGA